MSSSSYSLSLGSAPASLIRVIPRSPLTLQFDNALRAPVNLRYDRAHTQSHPRTRAKDRSSKNTPTNCEGLRYRTLGSSHLPHTHSPYYKLHLCFFGFEMGNIAHLALIGAVARTQLV
ncbi:hypothetical protein M405DRAFT_861929 [Rhizopogon salebrosus TDB-379]|nr:hypothetical protein M405DRAFT_861929 [Rhizopogon salebrosus TDB-379]